MIYRSRTTVDEMHGIANLAAGVSIVPAVSVVAEKLFYF